jgi:DUF4097 and DUF4098 domain-containing protein YvlB
LTKGNMKKPFQLATLFLAAGLAAAAQNSDTRIYRSGNGNEWIQEVRGTLPAARIVKVISTAGAIRVQGAQQNTVTYIAREHVRAGSEDAARRTFSRLKFSTGSGEITWLKAECEGSNQGFIDFEIQIPAQTAQVKLETEGGAVSARNILGKVEANTGGGRIELDQIGGLIAASSGGGDIEIGKAGRDVGVETGGGNIHIESASGRIVASSGGGNLRIGNGKLMDLKTGGGWIRVVKCFGSIKAETGGGSIDLTEILGPARIETGGGSIRVGSITGGFRAETGSGPIIAGLARGGIAFTDSRLETSVGDITIYIPDGLGLNIRANVEVSRGEGIQSDFPIKVTRSGDYGPREVYAEGSVNGGGPVLHAHTSTGNIVIKRKGKE